VGTRVFLENMIELKKRREGKRSSALSPGGRGWGKIVLCGKEEAYRGVAEGVVMREQERIQGGKATVLRVW